jgi:hypothetical protein
MKLARAFCICFTLLFSFEAGNWLEDASKAA